MGYKLLMKDIEKTKYEGHYKKLTFYQDFLFFSYFFVKIL